MSLKFGKNSARLFFMFLLITINATFFTIPDISDAFSSLATYHIKKLVFYMCVIMFLVLCITRKRFLSLCISWNPKDIYGNLVKYYLIMVAITMVLSSRLYSAQSLSQIFSMYYYFFIIIAYFFIIYWMKSEKEFCDNLCRMIAFVGSMYAIYMIVSKVVYMVSKEEIVLFSKTTALMQVRSGGLRLAQCGDMIGFSSILILGMWIRERNIRKKIVYLCLMITNLVCLLWVSQTRALIVAIVLAFVFTYLFCGKLTQGKMFTIIAGMIIMVGLLGNISNFLGTFSLQGDYYYSTYLRLSGYSYYLSKAFSNGIIGIGLIANNIYGHILHGTGRLSLTISDMGYCGFIGEFGLLGILFLIFWFIIIIKDIITIKKMKMEKEMGVFIGLFVYTTIGFWSLCFSDVQRSFYFPVIIAIFSNGHSVLEIRKKVSY